MNAYGQVYRVTERQWRAILMNENHDEIYIGVHRPSPSEAFADLKREGEKHDITDLRPWSGNWSPEDDE